MPLLDPTLYGFEEKDDLLMLIKENCLVPEDLISSCMCIKYSTAWGCTGNTHCHVLNSVDGKYDRRD